MVQNSVKRYWIELLKDCSIIKVLEPAAGVYTFLNDGQSYTQCAHREAGRHEKVLLKLVNE